MGLGDPTTFVYQLEVGNEYSDDTHVLQQFVLNGPGLCIKLNCCVAHMFYAWSFSKNSEVPTVIEYNKYYLFLDTYSTVFSWGAGNSNKIEHIWDNNCYN